MIDAGHYVRRVIRTGSALLVCGLLLCGDRLCAQSGTRGAVQPPPSTGPAGPGNRFANPGPQFRPVGPQVLVADVRITGNATVSPSKIHSYLKTRKDRVFDPEVVQADVRRLASSGMFQDVRTYTRETPAGMVVTFEVFERPTMRYIKYIGNRGITDKTLAKQVDLKVGDALNVYAVLEARRKIEDFYRTRGYPKTEVVVLEGDKPQDRGVVLMINEGRVQRILDVNFHGNTIATDARLRTQIKSKPGILWYFLRGKFDRQQLDEDLDRLTAYYRGLGYFGARVGREVEFSRSGKWVTLTFVIDEGPRYVVRNVAVVGNHVFSNEQLMGMLELEQGQHFHLAKMNRDVSMLRDTYGSQGYIFADIKADPRFLEEPGQLDLVYHVKEGEQYRVGRINVHIAGEFPHTRENVILNRISLRPGDIIDIRKVRASERRLKASQLFVNEPARGVTPRIVVRPPELQEIETLASEPDDGPVRQATYRGQSPDPRETGLRVRKLDLNVLLPPLLTGRGCEKIGTGTSQPSINSEKQRHSRGARPIFSQPGRSHGPARSPRGQD